MAIAYYIPDQAKLLARSSSTSGGSNQNMNNPQFGSQSTSSSSSSTINNSRRRTPTANAATQQQHHQQQQQQQQQQQHGAQQEQPQNYTYSNHFRANISIPLPQRQGSMTTGRQTESFGCWDLLAQIFCYALRFYNYTSTQRMPTVIQISFEISRRNSNSSQTNPESPEAGSGSTSIGKNQRH